MSDQNRTENDTIAELAIQTAERAQIITPEIDGDGFMSLKVRQTVTQDGEEVHHHTHEGMLDMPFRPRGTTQVTNVESLIQLENRKATTATMSFSDLKQRKITTVLNYDGWRDDRIEYGTEFTPEFKTWANANGKMMSQVEFAEMLQDLRHTIIDPQAAEVVQIARTFTATKTANFESGVRIQSGDVQFSFVENTKAQSSGTVEIPETITLFLPIFRDSRTAVEVQLDFRYDVSDRGLRLGYRILQEEALLENAWGELVEQARAGLQSMVLDGPAPTRVTAWQ